MSTSAPARQAARAVGTPRSDPYPPAESNHRPARRTAMPEAGPTQATGTGTLAPAPAARTSDRRAWLLRAVAAGLFLALAVPLACLGGKLTGVQTNDASAFLPAHAEATTVADQSRQFTGIDSTPVVLVYTRPS